MNLQKTVKTFKEDREFCEKDNKYRGIVKVVDSWKRKNLKK